ncbi:MAG: membrane protein insertase YidC [Acidobacteria bacterium]|nr:membrane protein insertase YidC [Acidobacteriota bacterium]
MNTEKRMLIAFALSFILLMLWRVLFLKEAVPPPSSSSVTIEHGAKPQTPAKAAKPPATPKIPPPPKIPVVQGTQAQDITVESSIYRVVFSTQGGVVKSWILRKYKDENGKPLDIIDTAACEQLGYPMSITTADSSLNQKINQALYVATPSVTTLKVPTTLTLTYSDGHVQVQKKFSFGSDYKVHISVSVAEDQHYVPIKVAWRGGFGDHSLPEETQIAQSNLVYESDGKLETVDQHKIEEVRHLSGPLAFAGLEDRYFAGIFFPGSGEQDFLAGQQSWTPQGWGKKEPPKALFGELGSQQAQPLDFQLAVLPKDLKILNATDPALEALVNFGWFSMIAKPLFLAMRYVHNHWVHNYGWDIVILTFFINMALFPLKLKSIRSAQEMQRVAPLVKSIQDRYKQYKFNDPRKQRMNQEIMKLYQEHHINPLGGCLPMLLQLPILYGFYEMLETPIEFRQAPWILWVKDLSMPDNSHILGIPIPILPVIMIVSMFILQKMTPMATVDPAQKRMMMLMPLVFGLMFFRLASGLVLYFLAANLIGIGQQVFINRMMTPKQPPLVPEKAVGAKA